MFLVLESLCLKRLRYILQSRYVIKIITIIFLILSIIYTNYYPFKSKYNKDDTIFVGIVINYELKEYCNRNKGKRKINC